MSGRTQRENSATGTVQVSLLFNISEVGPSYMRPRCLAPALHVIVLFEPAATEQINYHAVVHSNNRTGAEYRALLGVEVTALGVVPERAVLRTQIEKSIAQIVDKQKEEEGQSRLQVSSEEAARTADIAARVTHHTSPTNPEP